MMQTEKNGKKYVWQWTSSNTCKMIEIENGKPKSLGEYCGKVPANVDELLEKFGVN